MATPGPWNVDDNEDIIAPDGTHVVCFGHNYDDYGGIGARSCLFGSQGGERHSVEWSAPYAAEKAANARLLAAAPDLLAALRMLHDDVAEYARLNNLGGFDNHAMAAARAALAKAESDAG